MLVDIEKYIRPYNEIVKYYHEICDGSLRHWELDNKLMSYAIKFGKCKEHDPILVYFDNKAGARNYQMQCSKCFEKLSLFLKHDDLTEQEKAHAKERMVINRNEMSQKARDLIVPLVQEYRDRERDKYNDYLNSPEWQHKRQMVLKRDDYRCKARMAGCLGGASDVHHLTYNHFRNEPLFDLISVCRPCHDKITNMDRERR